MTAPVSRICPCRHSARQAVAGSMVQRAGYCRLNGPACRPGQASRGPADDDRVNRGSDRQHPPGMNQALRYGVYPADPTRRKLGLLRNAHSRYTMPHPLPARSRGSGTYRADGASMVGHAQAGAIRFAFDSGVGTAEVQVSGGADFLQLSPASAPARGLTSWLADAVRAAIIDGRLQAGAPLPPTRVLADDL